MEELQVLTRRGEYFHVEGTAKDFPLAELRRTTVPLAQFSVTKQRVNCDVNYFV
jgi:hypothetical protein